MNRSRRRRRYIRWCRYVWRAQVPFSNWDHRAPRCPETRMSGLVRAWDKVAQGSHSWPWRPPIREAPGSRPDWSATMTHDFRISAELRKERRARVRKGKGIDE